MYKTKFYLLAIITALLSKNIHSSCLRKSQQLLKNFTSTQVQLFIPRLLKHQQKTTRCFNNLPSNITTIVKPTHNPDIIFSYLLLCEKLNITPLATLFYAKNSGYEFPIFFIIQNNQIHHLGISPLFKKFPYSLQYFQLLHCIHSSLHNPPITTNHDHVITEKIIQTIKCPICLKMATIFNSIPTLANLLHLQIRKANQLCPAHQTHNTNPIEENLHTLQYITKKLPFPWQENASQETFELMNEIKNDDNSMGSLLDRIPPHMLPKKFV